MKTKFVKLDGRNSGLAVYLFRNEDFVKLERSNKRRLFKNVQSAKAFLASNLNIHNPCAYKFWIIIDDIEIDFDDVQKIDDKFECIYNDTYYFIQEVIEEKVINIGYLVFDDGYDSNHEKHNKKKDMERSEDLFKYCRNVLENLIRRPLTTPAIESLEILENDPRTDLPIHIVASVKGSTMKVHICHNSCLMNINMRRKEYGIRCIPYDAKANKYLSIFCFCTCDMTDRDTLIPSKSAILINNITEKLKNKFSEADPRYIPVQFKGIVTLLGGDMNV